MCLVLFTVNYVRLHNTLSYVLRCAVGECRADVKRQMLELHKLFELFKQGPSEFEV